MGILNKFFGSDDSQDDAESVVINTEVGDEEEESSEAGELALDVFQDKDNIYIKSTVAGVKPEDLDITISDNIVTISGERKREDRVAEDDYLAQECYWGAFYRAFKLPMEVDMDKASADIENGVLTLILPKASRSRTKKVRIGGEGGRGFC